MSEVKVRENESLESALKRFKRECAKSGVLAEVRKREHYEKPSVRRKKNPKQPGEGNQGADIRKEGEKNDPQG